MQTSDMQPPFPITPLMPASRLPQSFTLQYAGLLIFMIGDGVEVGYLSPFLVQTGQTEHFVALLFTVYGLLAALAAWFSGLLCDIFGSRMVMTAGLLFWIIPQLLFLGIAIPAHSSLLLLLTYGLRGAGYPLFSYGLLTLLVTTVKQERLGRAVGLFWFCFTCGLPTVGSIVAQLLLPHYGQYITLWIALLGVGAGGILAILPLPPNPRAEKGSLQDIGPTLRETARQIRLNPSVGLACLVRAVNSSATHGLIVFMPFFFTNRLGLSQDVWIRFLEIIFASNIIFNLLVGFTSDYISWRQTIIWFGCIGSTLSCIGLYWIPLLYAHSSLPAIYASAAMFGMTLAGYVPLSALTPTLLSDHKGIAMSLLNLGAGSSVWIGPFIVYLFEGAVGTQGIILIYAALFLTSAILTFFIAPPDFARPDRIRNHALPQSEGIPS